jgi:DNA-binding NarL/FixJ family response regulator
MDGILALLTQVLIADDSQPLRSALCKVIEEHPGWVCAQARNGRDAISKIQQQTPDILILSLCMSAMDGLQAARTISKLLPHLPILLCTSSAVPLSLVSMAQRCGIKGTVSKYDSRQIVSGIDALLRHETFFCRNAGSCLSLQFRQGRTHPVAFPSPPLTDQSSLAISAMTRETSESMLSLSKLSVRAY